jgi:pyridoxal phosphate enzyme (YggS family)
MMADRLSTSSIAANLADIHERVAEACEGAGRSPSELTIVAVSKTVGIEQVAAAIAAGAHDFGENRSLVFCQKQQAFPEQHWHFIGSIQTNKIKDFVGKAALVHSVASERALAAISKRAEQLGCVQELLIEVNVSGEESKDGVRPAELPRLLEAAGGLSGVMVRGLMTMAPLGDTDAARSAFSGLRELRDSLRQRFANEERLRLEQLSMGMSDDFPQAIMEGATIIRIGRRVWQ